MKLIPVKSSNISHVGWHEGTMEVHFQNGGQYQYHDVPQDIYFRLLQSQSKGKFLNREVVQPNKFKTTNLKPTLV